MVLTEPILTDWGFWLPPPIESLQAFNQECLRQFQPTLLHQGLPLRVLIKLRVNLLTGCWEWQGYCHVKNGYSQIPDEIRKQPVQGHIYVWQRLVGPIPADMTLDHRCRNRKCCWPRHIELKSGPDNTRAAFEDRYHMHQPPLDWSLRHRPDTSSGLVICN